jgi:DNA-binding beta-propeller fold protein YncE
VSLGENPIEGYTLNPSTGALTVISGSPFGLVGSFAAFDQSGTYFFLFDGGSANLSAFDVVTNSTLGTPLATAGSFLEPFAITDVP